MRKLEKTNKNDLYNVHVINFEQRKTSNILPPCWSDDIAKKNCASVFLDTKIFLLNMKVGLFPDEQRRAQTPNDKSRGPSV